MKGRSEREGGEREGGVREGGGKKGVRERTNEYF